MRGSWKQSAKPLRQLSTLLTSRRPVDVLLTRIHTVLRRQDKGKYRGALLLSAPTSLFLFGKKLKILLLKVIFFSPAILAS